MGGRLKEKRRKGYMLMAEGAAEAIKGILTTLTAYFPTVLVVRAGVSGMKAVLNFVRGAA